VASRFEWFTVEKNHAADVCVPTMQPPIQPLIHVRARVSMSFPSTLTRQPVQDHRHRIGLRYRCSGHKPMDGWWHLFASFILLLTCTLTRPLTSDDDHLIFLLRHTQVRQAVCTTTIQLELHRRHRRHRSQDQSYQRVGQGVFVQARPTHSPH
jgi:hypothetical protein